MNERIMKTQLLYKIREGTRKRMCKKKKQIANENEMWKDNGKREN